MIFKMLHDIQDCNDSQVPTSIAYNTYTHIHTYLHRTLTFASMYVHMHPRIVAGAHEHMHKRAHTYARTHIYTCAHIHAHIHTFGFKLREGFVCVLIGL